MGNANKTEQLGMPWGTAMHKLRKNIMFRMMQKCGEDTCHRCGETIETVDDLSIDHIKPWLYVSADLFWDLDNVTWSHRKCNVVDRREIIGDLTKQRWADFRSERIGTSRCYICHQQKPLADFTLNRSKATGVESACRSCRAVARAK